MADIAKLDRNMEARSDGNGISFYRIPAKPFRLTGFEYFESDHVFRRLPLSSRERIEQINPSLNELSEMTAGGQLSFKTDSSRVYVRAQLGVNPHMTHMAATGQSGFDCYVKDENGVFRMSGVTKFDYSAQEFTCEVMSGLPQGTMREIMIYFPLYGGVKDVEIGIDEQARLQEPDNFLHKGRLVFYGTSIMQGACASRPGTAYTALLSRWLGMEHLNFGFSGNAFGEQEIAEILAELDNTALYMIDYEANGGANGKLEATLEEFIETIRRRHSTVPIVVVSRIPHVLDLCDERTKELRTRLRSFQKKTVEIRAAQGDNSIYFVDGRQLLGEDFDDMTVDTIHPNDAGFYMMASRLLPILREILNV